MCGMLGLVSWCVVPGATALAGRDCGPPGSSFSWMGCLTKELVVFCDEWVVGWAACGVLVLCSWRVELVAAALSGRDCEPQVSGLSWVCCLCGELVASCVGWVTW